MRTEAFSSISECHLEDELDEEEMPSMTATSAIEAPPPWALLLRPKEKKEEEEAIRWVKREGALAFQVVVVVARTC